MDQKLSDLVNKVESEARAFATFDEYLESKEAEPAWQKPADGAADESSSVLNVKVDVTVASSPAPNAETVTSPTSEQHPHVKLTPEYIANGHKVEPAHPIAVVLDVPIPDQSEHLEAAPLVMNTVVITDPIEWDGKPKRFLEDIATAIKPGEEPDWYGKIFSMQRADGEKLTAEEIVERIHELEEGIQKFKVAQRGLRSALEDKLKEENSAVRTKMIGKLDMDYRARRNAKAAERMKSERTPKAKANGAAPKAGAGGIKFADAMATGMGLRGDALIDCVEKAGKLDEATANHIRTKWGSK